MSFKEQVEQAKGPQKLVGEYLLQFASTDSIFAEKLENKTLSDCFTYIRKEAQKVSESGTAMIEDKEVFGWAIHFVDEDIKVEAKTRMPIKEKKRNTIDVQIEEAKKELKKIEKELTSTKSNLEKAKKEQLENPTDLFAFLEEDSENVIKAKNKVVEVEKRLQEAQEKLDTLMLDATKGKPDEEPEGDENDEEDCDSCELDSGEDS